MPYQVPGLPRIALLNTSGVKLKTLFLPMPDKGLPKVRWNEKGQVKDLIDGSEANRRLGWIPEVTFRWSVYVDQISASFTDGSTMGAWGLAVGPNNGQMASMNDLLVLLSNAPGLIAISPGPGLPGAPFIAGGVGFVAQSWTISEIGANPLGQAEGVSITFRGGAIQSSMVLGAF